MDALARSDLFFMITAMVVLLVGAVILVAILYVVRILHDVRRITKTVREESDLIKEDFDDFRAATKKRGLKGLQLLGLLKALFMHKRKKRK